MWLTMLQTPGPALINTGEDALCTNGVLWLIEKGIAVGNITLSGDATHDTDIIESIELVAESFPQLEDISLFNCNALLDDAIYLLVTSCSNLRKIKFRCSCVCFSSTAILDIVEHCKNIECIDLGHWNHIRNPKLLTLAWHFPHLILLDFEGVIPKFTIKTSSYTNILVV
jgi:hypothetical protein